MSINKGSTSIGAVYHGSTEISEIYKGSQLLYSSGTPVVVAIKYTTSDENDYVNYIYTSTDNGDSYTKVLQLSPLYHRYFTSIACKDGMFIIPLFERNIATPGYTLYYSYDGTTWSTTTYTSPGSDYVINYVVAGTSLFAGIGMYGDFVYYSTDGLNWSYKYTGGSRSSSRIFFAGDKFYIISLSSGTPKYSTDCQTWSNVKGSLTANIRSMTYGNGYYMAVAYNGSVYRSSDGITWSSSGYIDTAGGRNIAFGKNTFVTCRNYSLDNGATWKTATGNKGSGGLIFAKGKFIAGGNNTSVDGMRWTYNYVAPNYIDWLAFAEYK